MIRAVKRQEVTSHATESVLLHRAAGVRSRHSCSEYSAGYKMRIFLPWIKHLLHCLYYKSNRQRTDRLQAASNPRFTGYFYCEFTQCYCHWNHILLDSFRDVPQKHANICFKCDTEQQAAFVFHQTFIVKKGRRVWITTALLESMSLERNSSAVVGKIKFQTNKHFTAPLGMCLSLLPHRKQWQQC